MGKKDKANVLFIILDNYQDDNVFPHTNEELTDYLSDNEFDIIGLGFMAARFKRTVEALCKVINQNKKDAWLVL